MLQGTSRMSPGQHAQTLSIARDQPLYRQFLRGASLLHGGSAPALDHVLEVNAHPGCTLAQNPDPALTSRRGPTSASDREPESDVSPISAHHRDSLPDVLLVRGSPTIPPGPRLGLVCSVRMKGALILTMYEYGTSLRPDDGVVVCGFHSPMERQVLELLLARRVPLIVVPARNPERMRIPSEWRAPMDEGRLTIVSGVGGPTRRPTRELALRRNLLVAALSDRVLIPCATPGGAAETVARAAVDRGIPLWTFRDEDNAYLLGLGAVALEGRKVGG